MHALGLVNRVALRALLKLRRIDFPDADLARLRAAVRPGTAAFLGPNHPEFMTDWLIDKEISRRVSPLMAHWASYEIVNASPSAQGFWLRNNLIANAPGGTGREYSIRWALGGHGVLLHPEGTASWQADRVGPLLPGIVEMAWETCRRTREAGVEKPIFVAPIVWKLRFRGAVHETLRREMAHIERRLDLQSGSRLTVEERLAVLQQNLLRRQWDRLELSPTPPELDGVRYFTAQRTAVDAILRELDRRYGPLEADLARIQHAVRRSLRTQSDADPLTVKRDRALLAELSRLMGFAPELYDRPALTQEQIAETLKRTRGMLLTRGRRDGMHNLIPIAAGPRDAFVRVPEPLAIHEAYSEEGGEEHRSALLRELRERMQRSLDGLLEAIRPAVTRHARQNPLHTGAGR